jgi:thiamine transport system substrate-binding protein
MGSMPVRTKRNHLFAAIAGLTAAATLAACATTTASSSGSSSPAATTSSAASASASASATAEQPAAGGTVRLLAHDSFSVSKDLIADFEKRTGLTLEIVTGGDAGAMVAGSVLAAGQPTADVMFGVDNTLLSRAVDAGVFAPYTSPEDSSLAPALQGDTADGQVTPVDYGDVCVNYDAASLKKLGVAAPTSLDDLVDPAYKDLLVVEDPGTSSPGLAFLLATIAQYGEDGWQDYWTKLRDNGVKVSGSWTDAYEGDYSANGGDRPMVVSYATSPPAEIVYASDPKPTAPTSSVLTEGCYRQVEYAGVLAGTPNEAAAQKVVDWLVSGPVQADVPLSMFVFPAREGTPLPDVFTKFAATVANPLQLPPDQVAANLSTWLSDWGTVMGR